MTIKDQVIAAVRTAAAGLAAFIITFLAAKGWDFPDEIDAQINVAVFLAVMAGWNFLVNLLATHVHPWFGYLLVVPKTPAYATSPIRAGEAGQSVVGLVILVLAAVGLIAVLVLLF